MFLCLLPNYEISSNISHVVVALNTVELRELTKRPVETHKASYEFYMIYL